MKKLLMLLCALTLVFGIAGVSGAVSWTDTIDFNPDEYINWFGSYSYTHDITDDGFGGLLSGDVVTSYSVTVGLYDDGGFLDFGEIARIDQPGILGDGGYNFSFSSATYGWSLAGLISLNFDGMLDISILSSVGDFYLDWSELVADGYSIDHNPVPEPATILLMGVGLLGLVGYSRKRFSKKS